MLELNNSNEKTAISKLNQKESNKVDLTEKNSGSIEMSVLEDKLDPTFPNIRKKNKIHSKTLSKKVSNNIFSFTNMSEALTLIISMFLEKHQNQEKVKIFIRTLDSSGNGYANLIKVLDEFQDFNLFENLNPNDFLTFDEEKKKQFVIERNNFFLRFLLNLEEQDIRMDDIVNQYIKLNFDSNTPEIEVDYFFLLLCDYRSQADNLAIKHNDYLKGLLINKTNEEIFKLIKTFQPRNYISKNQRKGDENVIIVSDEELNFMRNVIFSMIKRGFDEGLMKFVDLDPFCSILKEWEVWEKLILNIEPSKLFDLWKKIYDKTNGRNKSKKPTVVNAQLDQNKLKEKELLLLNRVENSKLEIPQNQNIKLNPTNEKEVFLADKKIVNDFTDLFALIHSLLKKKEAFVYGRRLLDLTDISVIKEVAFYFLEFHEKAEKACKLTPKIFEYSLDIDEDLGGEIVDKVIDSNNVKEYYMEKAIEKKYFRIAFPLSKYKQCKELLNTTKMQDLLQRYLRFGDLTYYALCLFSSINDKKLMTENTDKICKSFLTLTRDEEGMSRSRHPLITCVLSAEFLNRIGRLNAKFQYKCQSIAGIMLELGQNLQESIKDEDSLNYYLRTQTDDKGRSALEIIAENRFYGLLGDENVAAIVSKLWYGSGKTLDLYKFSRISSIFSSNIKHEQYENIISRDNNDKNTKAYSFQFNQYIKNCSVRYLVDSVSTILTTILYQAIIYAYVQILKTNSPPSDNAVFQYSNIFANIVVFSINLNLAFYLLYTYKTNRKLEFSVWILLDMMMTIGVVFNLISLPTKLFPSDTDTQNLANAIIYSFIIVCAWLRVTAILITTRTFGPFLRIIYLIMGMMINFMIIFCCFNTISAQIFTLLFNFSDTDFSAFFVSWVSLFMASFSLYNFSNFTDAVYLGYGLLIVFVTITNLMLLNLIVSIITNYYQMYESLADSENRAVLVLTYERIKWDEKYGLLILLPAPFNLFNVISIIILFFVPETKKAYYNKLLSQISYIVIALANFCVLLFSSLLLYPLAIGKSYLHSSYDNWKKFSIYQIHNAFFQALIRPFLVGGYLVSDLIAFWKFCYHESEEIEEIERKNFKLPKESINFLRSILESKLRQKKKTVHINEIFERIKDERKKSYTQLNMSGSFLNSSNFGNSAANTVNQSGDLLKQKSEIYNSVRVLCEKLMDKDEFIDVDRSLLLIPKRINYSNHFIEGLNALNMKQTLKGLRKYFFITSINNPIYSYRKLQQMIYKIVIKFKMILSVIPENYADSLMAGFEEENRRHEKMRIDALTKKEEEIDERANTDEAALSNDESN